MAEVNRDRLESLLNSANSTAQLVRNIYLTFLLFGTYLSITITSTTHEQLLKGSFLVLPLLNAKIPIFGFYLITPIVLVLFHFNILLHFYFLSRVLFLLKKSIQGQNEDVEIKNERYARMFAFPFNHLLSIR